MVPVGERVSDVNWQHQHAFHHYADANLCRPLLLKTCPHFASWAGEYIVVSFVANLGTFIGAAIIAEFFH
jgi:hypothetical protein